MMTDSYDARAAEIAALVARVRSALTDDLLSPDQRRRPRDTQSAGHCYVASEALYHLLDPHPRPYQIRHEENSHWFLWDWVTQTIIDATSDQFATPVPYYLATPRNFLTREPSKRCRVLLARLNV